MPPAIDSLGEPPVAAGVIAFSATPTEVPGRAWVIRLSRRGSEAALEIVRLRRRDDCNRYTVERTWNTAIPLDEYRAIAAAVAPWVAPPAGFPAHEGPPGVALDGTGLELRVRTTGWQVTRTLNQFVEDGPGLSAIFRTLLSRHVPASELPAEDWRTRRAPWRLEPPWPRPAAIEPVPPGA